MSFANKLTASAVAMVLLTVAQGPAILWYVTSATPACTGARDDGALLAAQVGLTVLGLAVLAVAVLLAVRVLRLRWAWLWWGPAAVAASAPGLVVAYLLPTLSPGVGGYFCL